MRNWRRILREVIPSPCYQRPFVCEGFPDSSDIVVIGENPATELEIDWWSFWQDASGFDYDQFLTFYQSERAKAGKGPISNTRRRLNRIRRNGLRCIETNAFSNERPGGVGIGISNFAVLQTLIGNMPTLKGIIAHGKTAHEFLNNAEVTIDIRTFKTRHFRQESYAIIDGICQEIRAARG